MFVCRDWRQKAKGLFDNCTFVQVKFLPPKCRDDSASPTVATDHQSVKRGGKAVTRNPTGNPVEQSWKGLDIRTCV
jgi:hypothetical protein